MLAVCVAIPGGAQQTEAETEPGEESLILIEDEAEPDLDQAEDSIAVGGLWDLVRMVIVLAIVLGMIYAVVWFLKRTQQTRHPETTLIDIAASQPLSGNRAVHLIRVGRQVFLIGEAENSVRLVSEITDDESLDEIRLRAPLEQENAGKSFSELLAGMIKGRSTSVESARPSADDSNESEQESPSLDFIQRRRERLKDL